MARTDAELTLSEIQTIEELDGIANNSVIYKNNSGVYTAVSLGDSGELLQSNGATSAPSFDVNLNTLAPLASPTFTGTVTTPAIKITTGAGAGKIATSDADGDLTWETPSSGGFFEFTLQDTQGQNFDGQILGVQDFAEARTLDEVVLISDAIPVGANATLELRKNSYLTGSSILSSVLTIATTDELTNLKIKVSTNSFTSSALADGDYLVAYLVTAGSTTPLMNAKVIVRGH